MVLDCHAASNSYFPSCDAANQNLAIMNEPSMRTEPVVILLDTDSQFRAMPVFCQQPLKG